jgi:hypothetical protein
MVVREARRSYVTQRHFPENSRVRVTHGMGLAISLERQHGLFFRVCLLTHDDLPRSIDLEPVSSLRIVRQRRRLWSMGRAGAESCVSTPPPPTLQSTSSRYAARALFSRPIYALDLRVGYPSNVVSWGDSYSDSSILNVNNKELP